MREHDKPVGASMGEAEFLCIATGVGFAIEALIKEIRIGMHKNEEDK